ncbi:MAG: hypothetical protein KDD53_05705 [Bdellovibrionales bacterium]|nr:hypothetical protein [Bdellovibrionales bacterium]
MRKMIFSLVALILLFAPTASALVMVDNHTSEVAAATALLKNGSISTVMFTEEGGTAILLDGTTVPMSWALFEAAVADLPSGAERPTELFALSGDSSDDDSSTTLIATWDTEGGIKITVRQKVGEDGYAEAAKKLKRAVKAAKAEFPPVDPTASGQ